MLPLLIPWLPLANLDQIETLNSRINHDCSETNVVKWCNFPRFGASYRPISNFLKFAARAVSDGSLRPAIAHPIKRWPSSRSVMRLTISTQPERSSGNCKSCASWPSWRTTFSPRSCMTLSLPASTWARPLIMPIPEIQPMDTFHLCLASKLFKNSWMSIKT